MSRQNRKGRVRSSHLIRQEDDHIECRRGKKIAAKGIYRDPVRSSRSFFVKTSGLHWLCLMLPAPVPWAERVWALPFLTVLAPSERYHQEREQRHKSLTDWARQMITQVRRRRHGRLLVVVADSSYAAIELPAACQGLAAPVTVITRLRLDAALYDPIPLAACQGLAAPVTVITRLRLDAALYDPAPPRLPGTRGAPRKTGARQPTPAARLIDPATVWHDTAVRWYGGQTRSVRLATGTAVWYHSGWPPVALRWVLVTDPDGRFEPQALLRTKDELCAAQIVAWFVMRRQLEVTFEEARAHVGIETRRRWSAPAILRTPPALLGLFSLVTLFAHDLLQGRAMPVRQAAWYTKELPTFSDTLAFVRRQLWPLSISWMSPEEGDVVKIPKALLARLTDALAYAA